MEEARAPRPRDGDPNVKLIRVSLVPEEWRQLRAWAAEKDSSVQQIVTEILRRALARRPPTSY